MTLFLVVSHFATFLVGWQSRDKIDIAFHAREAKVFDQIESQWFGSASSKFYSGVGKQIPEITQCSALPRIEEQYCRFVIQFAVDKSLRISPAELERIERNIVSLASASGIPERRILVVYQ